MKTTSTLLIAAFMLTIGSAQAQTPVSLDPASLQPVNVEFEAAVYQGRDAVRVGGAADNQSAYLALETGTFHNGVISLSLVGDTEPDAPGFARGFVGLAFRTADDGFEAIYLRPKNARTDNQLQRNHSVQYISEPGHTWDSLRAASPGVYETYVDLEVGVWTDFRIEVEGETARLFVHGSDQPTLVITDLKRGDSEGGIGLWVGPGTIAHFADVTIERRD